MPRRLPYVLLSLLLAIAAEVEIPNAVQVWKEVIRPETVVRAPLVIGSFSDRVTSVGVDASAVGVKKGDRILEINGARYMGSATYGRAMARANVGDILALRVASESDPAGRIVNIRLSAAPANPWSARAVNIGIAFIRPVFCLLLGFAVAFVRPRDPVAWILLGMMIGFACLAPGDASRYPDGARQIGFIFFSVGVVLWPVFMMLFGIHFPERSDVDRQMPWLKWLIIAPLAALAVLESAGDIYESENFRAAIGLARFLNSIQVMQAITAMTGVGSFFTLLSIKRAVTKSPDAKRRLHLLLTGAQVALTPIGVLFCFQAFGHIPFSQMPPWIVIPAVLLIIVFPATLAYTIVVHRALDVRVVVRQGLQYALARGGVRVLQAAIGAGVLFFAVSLADNPEVSRPAKLAYISLGVVIVVRIRSGADVLRRWLDRRFFREAVNTERVLGELNEKVRSMVETGPLLKVVSQTLSDSLHVKRVVVLLDESHEFSPAYSVGFDAPPSVPIQEAGAVAQRITESGPAQVYLDDPSTWVHQESDRAALRSLDTQLLLPLVVRGQLLGIVSLGPKQSEEPYSTSDLQMLQSVAAQTGLALANARLTAAVAAETAQRERLNREVEIAREVQERLFPQNAPVTPGLDYCGHCRPALGVGGDYYDFVALPGGALGIAIGDVSGKGIAAALLMASLQASLRGQTLRDASDPAFNASGDLATIMRRVNKLVYEASSSNRYATFFYAQYNPVSRRLSYVNAGHNPPVVLRGGEAIRLEDGGAVVGLLPDFPYGEGSVDLQSGDLFVGFTDGISESMNPEDEEWGEGAMIDAARQCGGRSARETLDYLMNAADAFARGAKQHDDMTLVVARVLSAES